MTRKMKDSGVEWIGEIPEDWEVASLNRVLKSSITDGPHETPKYVDEGIPFISVDSLGYGKKANLDIVEKYITEEDYNLFNKKTQLKTGDLLFTKAATIGKLAIKDERKFMVWSPIAVIKPNEKRIESEYLYNVFSSNKYISHVTLLGTANTQINVGMGTLEKSKIPLPPQIEQKSIGDFLDDKTQEIDNIISKTKKAIEEYKKYKQSLITETVTKGLDENVEMKDSGIEWIGNIPKHWNVRKFKDLFKFGSGLTITKSDLIDEGIKVINYGEIHSKYKFDLDINRDELKCVDKSYLENRKIALINTGDFVFCDTSEDREGSGNCIVLRENNDELIFAGSHTVTARLIRNEDPIYIRYMIMASSVKEQISSTVVGIKVYSITQAILKTIIGVIPPLKEQEEIVSFLDKKTNQIDQIISAKEKLLIEMEAYKKSLIYETVTGKREVE